MKVKEMIEELQKYNPEAEVIFNDTTWSEDMVFAEMYDDPCYGDYGEVVFIHIYPEWDVYPDSDDGIEIPFSKTLEHLAPRLIALVKSHELPEK